MCFVKQINGSYINKNACFNLINYTIGEHCQNNIYSAAGLLCGNAQEMEMAMHAVKDLYGKNDGRQMLHFVIEFWDIEAKRLNADNMFKFGYEVCQFFYGYQCVFGYHENTSHLHMHVAVNSVSYMDGSKYGIGIKGVYELNQYVKNILRKYLIIEVDSWEEFEKICCLNNIFE